MARIVYDLRDFDAEKASQGALCAIVALGTGGTIANIDEDGNVNDDFIGAGICKKESPECYSMVVGSVYYKFSAGGRGRYPKKAVNYILKMATPEVSLNTAGNSSTSSSTVTSSRGNGGTITTKVDYTKSSDIVIDTLNARDEFAINALRELLCHVDNPAVLSNSEMNFYCDRAYQWAANMMSASANARGTFKQETDTSSGTTETKADTTTKSDVDTSTLTSNTEKLLNNIVSALERTDYAESTSIKNSTTGETTQVVNYYDRVKLQFSELMDFLNAYVKNDKEVLGLKDLLTAINTVGTNIKSQDFTSLVNAIKAIKLEAASDINIGANGVGGSKDKPLYMSGGGFPTRASLAASLMAASINSFLTFNSSGAVAYSTLAEVKKAILGWYNSYTDIASLYQALKASVESTIDERVKSWLNATTIVKDGDGYKINVPDSI